MRVTVSSQQLVNVNSVLPGSFSSIIIGSPPEGATGCVGKSDGQTSIT